MLAKRFRLPIQSTVSQSGRSIRSAGLTLKVFSTNLPYGRFGVIIPKAVASTAVLRNKLKRAAFDTFAKRLVGSFKQDVLCIISKGGPLTKDAMMKELTALISRLTD